MKKNLFLLITLFTIVLISSSLAIAFQIIPKSSSNFPGMASDGSEAFTQQTYSVKCDDGHEISCLQHSYKRISGIAVGCAADYRQGHKLYITDKSLMNVVSGSSYLPSASVESIGRAFCINAAPEGRP